MSTGSKTAVEAVRWHELECGSYAADLPLWRELASKADGDVLELGAGTGRVAVRLARSGPAVTGIDIDPDLVAELNRKADAVGVGAEGLVADIAELDLERRFSLILAPMHIIQMLPGEQRAPAITRIAEHLEPGGTAALAIVEPSALEQVTDPGEPLPDIREIDGWIYSSLPLWFEVDGWTITAKRLRERVSPDGEKNRHMHEDRLLIVDAAMVEDEAAAAGLEPVERRPIDNGPNEADSTVVILERR